MRRVPFLIPLLGFLLGGGATAQDSRPLLPKVLASAGRAVLLEVGPQRALVLAGTPHEMGFQHGKLLAEEVRTVVAETLAWTHAQGLSRADLQALRVAAAPFVPQRYASELEGLAAGSGVPLEDLWLVHMMPSKFHCTGAAAARTATRDGKVYHLRSLDYALDIGVESRLQAHALLIVRHEEDAIPSAVPSWAGVLGAVTGINGAGIAIGEMGSECKDEDQRGIPMIFQVREVLRSATSLAQAVALFRAGPSTCGYHFVVSSGDENDALAIEVTRNHFATFGLGDAAENQAPHTAIVDVVRRSNHFVAPALAATQRDPYDPSRSKPSSWQAYRRMTEFLAAKHGSLDEAAFVELLRLYPKGHPCLHQAVFAPAERAIWVAQARDDRKSGFPGAQNQPFVRYDLRALWARDFTRPVRVAEPAQDSTATREVVLEIGTRKVRYEIAAVQSAGSTMIFAASPNNDGAEGLPELEMHTPRALNDGAPGCVIVASGEPGLVATRVLAQALAAEGVACVVLPLASGKPARVATTLELGAAAAALFPGQVSRKAVCFVGLGLGAGPALRLAGSVGRPTRAALLFTTRDLPGRVVDDPDTARWLGIVTESQRVALRRELADLEIAATRPEGVRQVLFVAAGEEKRLPREAQRELARTLEAELHWHDGSLRALQRDASALAGAIRSFASR